LRNRGAQIVAKRKRRTDRRKRATKEQLVAHLSYHRRLMDRGVLNWTLMLMRAKGEEKELAVMIKALQS
jgi:hypothetical protein